MEAVAIISVVSILAWFLLGINKSVNINNYSEDELRDEIEKEKKEKEKN